MGSGTDANTLYRYGADGQMIWERDHISWNSGAKMLSGAPGFVYLGFYHHSGTTTTLYGQKVDIRGRVYWPTWGSGSLGARIATYENLTGFMDIGFAYRDGLFYGMHNEGTGEPPYLNSHNQLWLQALNPAGRQRWGANGICFATSDTLATNWFNVVPDDRRGAVCVWRHGWDGQILNDVWAKHINADGSLGGPQPPTRTAAPTDHNQTLSVSQNIIRYELPTIGRVSLALYNLLGQQVAVLEQGEHIAGAYTLPLSLDQLPSGIFLLQLTTPSGAQTAKVAIVR